MQTDRVIGLFNSSKHEAKAIQIQTAHTYEFEVTTHKYKETIMFSLILQYMPTVVYGYRNLYVKLSTSLGEGGR